MNTKLIFFALAISISCSSDPEVSNTRQSERHPHPQTDNVIEQENHHNHSTNSESKNEGKTSSPETLTPPQGEQMSKVEADEFSIIGAEQPVLFLASEKKIIFKVAANDIGDEKIKLDFNLEATALNSKDIKKAVKTTIQPTTLELTGKETKELTLHIEAGSLSPSIKNTDAASILHLIATSQSGEKKTLEIKLTILPEVRIEIRGNSASTIQWKPEAKSMQFLKHDQGLKVHFVNMDQNVTHIIHGSGAIPHQNVNAPLQRATATKDGGVYTVSIGTNSTTGGFYSHTFENSAATKTLQFNAN